MLEPEEVNAGIKMMGRYGVDANLIQPLRRHAVERPGELFCSFLVGDNAYEISFGLLISRAAAYARLFRAHGVQASDTVFIILRHRPDLLYAFLGAMLAGCIPAFLSPLSEKQDPESFWATLNCLLDEVGAAAAVVEPEEQVLVSRVAAAAQSTRLIEPIDISVPVEQIVWPDPCPDDVAFLQFSSGTTGHRKGVILSHRVVMEQIEVYRHALSLDANDRVASWLPLYHDMGLIACFIIPLVTATPIVLLDAFEWVYEPARLFEAIARYRATLIWLPNFAFNHLCATVAPVPVHDLGSVRAFVNCSEPCKIDSMRRFAERFAPMNVRIEQLQTCYAMAEAVFAVAQSRLGEIPFTLRVDRAALTSQAKVVAVAGAEEAIELVSVGHVLAGYELRILGPDKADLPADRIGEIAIRGPCLFSGYYRSPGAGEQPFFDGWYLTGDLGFVRDQHLFVTGREKDVIIVYGRNFYSHDIEEIVGTVDGIKAGRAVAIGLYNALSGSEDAIVIAETDETDPAIKRRVKRLIKSAVVRRLDLTLASVVLVPPKWLIKTTSGKLSRDLNRKKYLRAAPDATYQG